MVNSCSSQIRTGSLWDRALVEEGQALVRHCLRWNTPGPYQIQAAIAAVHSDAHTAAATEWSQIVQLYDRLYLVAPTPVVALHRAVAVAEVDGPAVALGIVDTRARPLPRGPGRARDLLRRLGCRTEAADEYTLAAEQTGNDVERQFLLGCRDELSSP